MFLPTFWSRVAVIIIAGGHVENLAPNVLSLVFNSHVKTPA
jgi:hypothetical protein